MNGKKIPHTRLPLPSTPTCCRAHQPFFRSYSHTRHVFIYLICCFFFFTYGENGIHPTAVVEVTVFIVYFFSPSLFLTISLYRIGWKRTSRNIIIVTKKNLPSHKKKPLFSCDIPNVNRYFHTREIAWHLLLPLSFLMSQHLHTRIHACSGWFIALGKSLKKPALTQTIIMYKSRAHCFLGEDAHPHPHVSWKKIETPEYNNRLRSSYPSPWDWCGNRRLKGCVYTCKCQYFSNTFKSYLKPTIDLTKNVTKLY